MAPSGLVSVTHYSGPRHTQLSLALELAIEKNNGVYAPLSQGNESSIAKSKVKDGPVENIKASGAFQKAHRRNTGVIGGKGTYHSPLLKLFAQTWTDYKKTTTKHKAFTKRIKRFGKVMLGVGTLVTLFLFADKILLQFKMDITNTAAAYLQNTILPLLSDLLGGHLAVLGVATTLLLALIITVASVKIQDHRRRSATNERVAGYKAEIENVKLSEPKGQPQANGSSATENEQPASSAAAAASTSRSRSNSMDSMNCNPSESGLEP